MIVLNIIYFICYWNVIYIDWGICAKYYITINYKFFFVIDILYSDSIEIKLLLINYEKAIMYIFNACMSRSDECVENVLF